MSRKKNHVVAEAQKVMHADMHMGTTHDNSIIHNKNLKQKQKSNNKIRQTKQKKRKDVGQREEKANWKKFYEISA